MIMIRKGFAGAIVGLSALALVGCASSDAPEQTAFGSAYDLLVAQDYASARDAFLAILSNDPNNAYAHLNLGVAYEELGETELARTHYGLALQNGSDAPIAGTVEDGVVKSGLATTVGALANQNLAGLGG